MNDKKHRSVNPWVGHPSKTRESRVFGGYSYYYQVRWFNGIKHSNKKFYYDEGDDRSERSALQKAEMFRTKKALEMNVVLDQ